MQLERVSIHVGFEEVVTGFQQRGWRYSRKSYVVVDEKAAVMRKGGSLLLRGLEKVTETVCEERVGAVSGAKV